MVVAGDLPVPQLIIADLGPTPGFASDPARGRLYATWDAGHAGARDVFVARSVDDSAASSVLAPAGAREVNGRAAVWTYLVRPLSTH